MLTEELGMRKICAKLVPKNLINEQKETRKDVCLYLLERIENDENFCKHVTGDESITNEQIESQTHANLFFRQSRCCSKGIRAPNTNR